MKRLYILVRRDLGRGAQAVQSAHAAIDLVYRHPERFSEWGRYGPTIALLQVEDGSAIEYWQARLGEAATTFCEPDLGDIPTALAYYGEDRVGLSELRLLG